MGKIFLFLVLCFYCQVSAAQEMNCQIVINAEKTGQANNSVFRTLESALTEFVNKTQWTSRDFEAHERINCSMFINIDSYQSGTFSGSLQVQSSRPIYGSTMVSPVFNFKDEQFSFSYMEHEPLNYSPNQYDSNLVSVLSFYIYTILGLDADTYEEQAGTAFFQEARQIVNTAQQGGNAGWKATDGNRSRYQLNADLLSNAFTVYRSGLYKYHRKGLDLMHDVPTEGKKAIAATILELSRMNDRRPNSLLLRTFFDAKADEIEHVFSGGPSIDLRPVADALQEMAPTFSDKWANLRY